MTGRFFLRVSSSEASGPPGKGSRAEREARVPRPESDVKILSPLTHAHIAGPLATAQLAAIAATQRTDVGRGRVRSEQEVDHDALVEHEAEERAWWRANRPLSKHEWARREERG